MWWLLFSDLAVKGGAASITWIGNTELLVAAGATIALLLERNAGRGSEWRVNEANSEGRLVMIRETDGTINVSPTSNKDRK